MTDCGTDRGLRDACARVLRALVPAAAVVALSAPVASADFPYTGPNGNIRDPTTWKLPPGVTPSNFGDNWKLAATPEQSPQSDVAVNGRADELCGIRGMSVVDDNAVFPAGTNSCVTAGSPVNTAFESTLGRPDVLISELDSGVEWNDAGAMTAVRKKIWLNAGELPAPRDDMMQTFDPSTGVNCAAHYGAVGAGGNYNPRAAHVSLTARSPTTSSARASSTCSITPATRAWLRSWTVPARCTRCATGRRGCWCLRT